MTASSVPDGTLVAVVIVAAGEGSRLGLAEPKALVAVRDATILEHCLASVFGVAEPVQIVVVAPANRVVQTAELCRDAAGAAHPYVTVVAGGASRQASVAAGLAAVHPWAEVVLVHDAARAFTPTEQFARVISAVRATGGGVLPALPVTDTIKQTDAEGAVERTIDRSTLVAVQTPQGFPAGQLRSAYARATAEHTDDAALVAAAGHPVTTVAGDALAFKITTPWDLRRAEQLVDEAGGGFEPRADEHRTGIGIDVHAFDPQAPLWLGGLFWPDEPGLAGHSDGDALSHALCDAMLSAAGLGDIGGRFGTADSRFAGAHGDVFLTETVALLTGSGWTVQHLAAQVVGERPRMSRRRDEVQERLTGLVGAPVSVSATTTDGLGFLGRGDGVAVIATALVCRTR
ncbi:MAG: hypothetical protein RI885_1419 [Actinomycetota bacterium]